MVHETLNPWRLPLFLLFLSQFTLSSCQPQLEHRNLFAADIHIDGLPTNEEAVQQQQQQQHHEVVRIKLQLTMELDPDDTTHDPNEGDFESWLCLLHAMYQQLLLNSNDNNSDNSQTPPPLWLGNLVWSMTQTHATLKLDASVPGLSADALLLDLQAITLNDMNTWMQQLDSSSLDGKSFPWQTTTMIHWDGQVSQVSPSGNGGQLEFSSDNCGVAHVTLQFDFFPEAFDSTTGTPNDMEASQHRMAVQNLLCASQEYFAALFGQLWLFLNHQPLSVSHEILHVTIDRVEYHFATDTDDGDNEDNDTEDDTARMPFTIQFELRALDVTTTRRLDPMLLLEWMQHSYWEDYIQLAAWEALPYKNNVFFHTRKVQFNGVVQPNEYDAINQKEELPPEKLLTTNNCVDGIMVLNDGSEAEPERADKGQVTNMILEFGFQDGFGGAGVSPTMQDMEALFCQTFFQLKDMLRRQSTTETNIDERVPYHVQETYTDVSLEAYDWGYNAGAEYPVTLSVATEAYFDHPSSSSGGGGGSRGRHRKVDPALLWDKITQNFDIQRFYSDYVWEMNPPESYLYHSDQLKYEGGVIPATTVHSAALTLTSDICHRTTEAPSAVPTRAPVDPTASAAPTVAETAEPTIIDESPFHDTPVGEVAEEVNVVPPSDQGDDLDTNTSDVDVPGYESIGAGSLPNRTMVVWGLIVIHLPNIPLNDHSDQISNALDAMLTEMIASKPRRGTYGGYKKEDDKEEEEFPYALPPKFNEDNQQEEPSSGDRFDVGGLEGHPQVPSRPMPPKFNEDGQQQGPSRGDSLDDGELESEEQLPYALPPKYNTDEQHQEQSGPLPPTRSRRRVEANIDLGSVHLGDASSDSDCASYFGEARDFSNMACSKIPIQYGVEVFDEDPEDVRQELIVMTQVGVETGLLQKKLDEIDPGSGIQLVPDPAQTAGIAIAAATGGMPNNEESTEQQNMPDIEVLPPDEEGLSAEPTKENGTHPPLWGILALVALVVGVFIITSMSGQSRRDRLSKAPRALEGFLSERQLRQEKYSDMI